MRNRLVVLSSPSFDCPGGCLILADSVQKPGGEETPVMQSSAIWILRHRVGTDGEWIEGETVAPVRILSQCVSTPGLSVFMDVGRELV